MTGVQTCALPISTIYAWSGALRKRGEFDKLDDLVLFADKLEEACIDTLNKGVMTKDLVGLVKEGTPTKAVNSLEFIQEIRKNLQQII